MAIRNDRQLLKVVEQASFLLQEISDYAGRDPRKRAAVRFPRGFIRSASAQRSRLAFVEDAALRSNIAYTLLLSDAIYWLIIRTDLTGTVGQMLVKLFLFVGATLCESITKDYLAGHCGKGYKDRTAYLVQTGVISSDLQSALDWLWDVRNNLHLFLLDAPEYENEYDAAAQARCVDAFRDLIAALASRGSLPHESVTPA